MGSLLAAMALLVACIGTSRAKACSFTSDCESGICNLRGFCESECRTNADCPCGAFCATSCGICLRNDKRGPASCFAFRHGYDTNAVLGACLAERSLDGVVSSNDASVLDGAIDDDAAAMSVASSEAGSSAAGPCELVEPVCSESPPLEAAVDAPGEADGSAPDAEIPPEADASDASDADATSEGGVP